jgi:uncharacterized protein YhfF
MTVEVMWKKYLELIGESLSTSDKTYESWYFCNNEKDANHLAELTKKGIKRATASLAKSYELEKEPLPKEGEFHIVTDFYGNAVCIIEATKVELIPFKEVTEEHAAVEGEGDGSLAYWREGHLKFFTEEAHALQFEFNESALVVFMRFKVVYAQ